MQKFQQLTRIDHQLPQRTKMYNIRRLSHLWLNSLALLICLICIGLGSANAAMYIHQIAPTHSVYSSGGDDGIPLLRLRRDISAKMMLEESKLMKSTSTAAPPLPILEQPQGQCLLNGVLVMEANVTCEKQMGCRAIQKTGYCCPDYKCDCQKDGITYLNGDKLVDPETPCTVCYCQGGEILCSSVTCFHRDDCNPKYIPGRCCPEYDNCPVSISDPHRNGNNTNNFPTKATTQNASTTTTAQPAVPPKITIKEITKPIEIRITDENKAIPIHQMLKPQLITSTTSTTTITFVSTSDSITPTTKIDDSLTQTPTAPTVSAALLPPRISAIESESKTNQSGENTKTTISNSTNYSNTDTGNKTNFSADKNPKTTIPVTLGINNVESLKLSASVAYPSTERNTVTAIIPASIANTENGSGNDSIEVSAEVEQLIEDSSVIPVFGAQELQRDASSNDPTKVNIKRENLATTERATVSVNNEEYASQELIDGNGSGQSEGLQLQSTFDLEPETSGSDNIYHIILTTPGPRIDASTEGFANFKSTDDLQNPNTDVKTAASNQQHSNESSPAQISNTTDTPLNNMSTTPNSSASTQPDYVPASLRSSSASPLTTTDMPELLSSTSIEAKKPSTHMDEEETAIPMEANPAYPSLPEDDFSLRDVNFPLSETDDAAEADVKDEQRSIGGAFDMVKAHKVAEEGSGNGIELIESSSTAAYDNLSSDKTTEMISKSSTKVELLMNSAEDLSAETTISNSSDFQMDNLSRLSGNATKDSMLLQETQTSIETGSGDSLEEEEKDKKLEKPREPTTPKPTQRAAIEVDIDELGDDASGDSKSDPLDDPKLDAESIKADENVEEGIVKQEPGQKEDVLTVNAKPTEERTIEETPAAATTLGMLRQMFLQRFV